MKDSEKLNRGYISGLYILRRLERMFCKALGKYAREFQKWDLPLDIKSWFNGIFRGGTSSIHVTPPVSFSQPAVGQNILNGVTAPRSQP